ncbi:Hypothetical predicted protein [Paramuricea clavata]|uniref:Uncharacterized protein n=1 Tax=Paramuricea clavata TaxID=317549 RepID=A0A7D9L998_PARCT|nr:Hypothetical predicted protein [Paramuricea clavata]
MPPKTADLKTLIGKRDKAIQTIKKLFEEFEEVFSVEPQLERLEENGGSEENQLLSANQKVGESLKENYLKVAKAYAAYQKKLSRPSPPRVNSDSLEAMTSAITKMPEAMQGSKPSASGLEKLPVPTWDGSRRSYSTWKKEFNHWMNKCS